MKYFFSFLVLAYYSTNTLLGLDSCKQYPVIKPIGYVKWEGFLDSRQVLGFSGDQVLYLPRPRELTQQCKDRNARPAYTMTAIETFIGVDLAGPTWCDKKFTGQVSGNFIGVFEEFVATFQLVQAWSKISWPCGSFLFGYTDHPFDPESYTPATISYNSGVPFELFSRNPQLRFAYKSGPFEHRLSFLGQFVFVNNGPYGFSSRYLRHSGMPNIVLDSTAKFGIYTFGAGFDYKRLVPRLVTDKNYKTKEHINSITTQVYAAIKCAPWSARCKVLYSQNGTNLALISGYAVATIDPITDYRTYTNTQAISAWFDASYIFSFNRQELGLFIGGLKNLGAQKPVYFNRESCEPIVYVLFPELVCLDTAWRVSPRYVYSKDPVRFGIELEITHAAYGCIDRKLRVHKPYGVTNIRLLTALYYIY